MYLLSKRGFNFTNLAALFTGISYIFWPKIIGFIEAEAENRISMCFVSFQKDLFAFVIYHR